MSKLLEILANLEGLALDILDALRVAAAALVILTGTVAAAIAQIMPRPVYRPF